MTNHIRWQALSGCALVALAHASSAHAQAASSARGASVGEVVVTGSRVIQNGYRAPTPVTVITQEQLRATAPTSLSDAVNQLPSFRNSFTTASTGFLVGAAGGGAFLNLRGLSAKRNLVLLDGRRLPSSSVIGNVAGATDLNVLPQGLVSKVDVVTGGASAAYGSDAVSGVINFVLDTQFTGVKGEVDYGLSDRGDNQNGKVSLAVGAPFASGRGHIVGALEYLNNRGVKDFTDREWGQQGYAVITTRAVPPAQTGLDSPTRIIAPNVRASNMASGGLITSGPLAGQYFNASGGLSPFPFGNYRTATTMSGGGIDPDYGQYFSAVPPQYRANGFVHASYDLTPDWSVYAEGMYGYAETKYRGLLSSSATHQPYTIFADNAYLTPAQRAALGATPSFTLGRIDTDFPYHQEYSTYDMKRGVVGVDGKVGPWTIKAYYEHGESAHKTYSAGNAILTNLFDAVDAVVAPSGSIVCRTTLTNPGNGCIPLNVLGPNTASAAAVASVTGAPTLHQLLKQDVADFSIAGQPFSLWAGPISVGGGASYRKETASATSDPVSAAYNPAVPGTAQFKPGLTPILSGNVNRFPAALRGQLGGYESGNTGALRGEYSVKEVFAETLVPLAVDLPLIRSLDLNAAIRYASYSTSGGVTSWKLGLTYEPVEGLRFRGTRSRDVRAANLAELYQGVTQNNAAVTDPFRGNETNSTLITRNFGNPSLDPEQGDTTTVGVVYQPGWFQGFSVSVDYYNIVVSNAIQQLGGPAVVNGCRLGAAEICALINRSSDPSTFVNGVGPILSLDNPFLNVGSQKTAGVDIEASYRAPMDRFVSGWQGNISSRVLVNYVAKLTTAVQGATSVTDQAGVVGVLLPSGSGGGPHWSGSFNVAYDVGPFGLFVQERFIGSGRNQAAVDSNGNPISATSTVNANPTGNGLVPNKVGAVFYTDVTLNYKFGKDRAYEGFLTINNLMDRDPPVIPTFFFYGTIATNYQLYDLIGRTYTAGLRFRF